jgi:glucose/arabinose dehydrogenase
MPRRARSVALSVVIAACIAVACVGSDAARATPGFSFTQVAAGFVQPVFVTSAPGDPDTLYVVEKRGTIQIVKNGVITGTFLDIKSLVDSDGEHGLLSMAFSPKYATNHLFYVSYSNLDGNSRIAVYHSSGGLGVPSSAQILFSVHQPYPNHKGGQLQFDNRGYLYVAFGDGGSAGDPDQHAQDLNSKLGKMFRSSTTTPNAQWKMVGLGLRNPWRFSFDSLTGNLWIGDVGQNTWEEVDFRGAANLDRLTNYGWSRYEGYSVFNASHTYTNTGPKWSPVLVYGHVNGQCSITGGYVYRGSAVPAAEGRYFYGDYCAGTIWSFATDAHGRTSPPAVAGNITSPSSFGTNGHGDLFAVSLQGKLYELEAG